LAGKKNLSRKMTRKKERWWGRRIFKRQKVVRGERKARKKKGRKKAGKGRVNEAKVEKRR